MTKRQEVVTALEKLVRRYNTVFESGKTIDIDGTRMVAIDDRTERMLGHFAKGEAKGLGIEVVKWMGRVELSIRHLKSATLTDMLEMIEKAEGVLEGPLHEVRGNEEIVRDEQLKFVGAVRRELDALEKRIRNNRHGAELTAYDFEIAVERLRKELWP